MTIWFDMDGTIANLYAIENWLEYLQDEDIKPYAEAKPLVNMARLAKALHKVQRNGYKIGIISWTSKNGSVIYNKATANAKIEWLKKHLPSVEWNTIQIVNYGVPKKTLADIGDVLVDDEEFNRNQWGMGAYKPSQIFEILATI